MAQHSRKIWHTGEIITAEKMNAIEEKLGIVNSVAANISNIYNETTSYEAGDYCIYNDKLYKAIIDTIDNQPPNPAVWQQTDIGQELQDMSAYEMARKQGYEGSFEDFMETLGNGAIYAQEAADAAALAQTAASRLTLTTSEDLEWILGGDDDSGT